VEASDFSARLALDRAAIGYAIFGQRARADTPLRDGDRVELTRPLVADPKDARRRRARDHPLAKIRRERSPGSEA
jgi:putative ubiquitin-RnfH superfamily antitoxin RatB of RatAB toxin-antitoxin module